MNFVIVPGAAQHAFMITLGKDHRLFFVRHTLWAYRGPLGNRLFTDKSKVNGTVRAHLNMMLNVPYVEFKKNADRRPRSVIPDFMAGLVTELAREAVLKRIDQ